MEEKQEITIQEEVTEETTEKEPKEKGLMASELIKRLQMIIDEHGDKEVTIYLSNDKGRLIGGKIDAFGFLKRYNGENWDELGYGLVNKGNYIAPLPLPIDEVINAKDEKDKELETDQENPSEKKSVFHIIRDFFIN